MHENHTPSSLTRAALPRQIPNRRINLARVAGALLGLFAAQTMLAAEHFVNMTSLYAFDPGSITIEVGDTVTWYNQDGDDHDVVSDTGAWTPLVVLPGESGSLVFNNPGTFPYRDSLWVLLGMKGSLTVIPVRPPTVAAPVRPDPSQFQFTISGTAGQTYVIETSGNLTDWVAIDTNVAPENIFLYTDASATNSMQFYRITRAP